MIFDLGDQLTSGLDGVRNDSPGPGSPTIRFLEILNPLVDAIVEVRGSLTIRLLANLNVTGPWGGVRPNSGNMILELELAFDGAAFVEELEHVAFVGLLPRNLHGRNGAEVEAFDQI